MKTYRTYLLNPYVWIVFVLILSTVPGCAQTTPKRITVEELSAALDIRQAIVVDVRDTNDWNNSDQKIEGAIRLDPRNPDLQDLPLPKDAPLVLY